MGIQKWGAFGGFQKKTGPLVGHWLNGQNVITPLPHPSQEPPTTPQLDQRSVFGLVVGWLRLLKLIIRTGFLVHKETESPWSAAVGYNLKNAVTGVSPNFTLDYPAVKFTKGDLTNPLTAGVTATVAAELTFTWIALVNPGAGGPTDKATFVVFCPTLWTFVTVVDVVPRSALTYDLSLPAEFSGESVHCWMLFKSADGKRASDSEYLGLVPVV